MYVHNGERPVAIHKLVLWWGRYTSIYEIIDFVNNNIYKKSVHLLNECTRNGPCFKIIVKCFNTSVLYNFFDLSFPDLGWPDPGISDCVIFLLLLSCPSVG